MKLIGHIYSITDEKEREILKASLLLDGNNKLNVCEQMRFTYDLVEDLPESELKTLIIEQLIDIFGMTKKMNARLAHYKRHYGGDTGNSGSNIKRLVGTSIRKKLRQKRII